MATSGALNKDFGSVVSQYPDDSVHTLKVTFSPETTIPEIFDLEVSGYTIYEDDFDSLVRMQPDRTSVVSYWLSYENRGNDKSNAQKFLQAAWNNLHVLKVVDDGIGEDTLDREDLVIFFDKNGGGPAPHSIM